MSKEEILELEAARGLNVDLHHRLVESGASIESMAAELGRYGTRIAELEGAMDLLRQYADGLVKREQKAKADLAQAQACTRCMGTRFVYKGIQCGQCGGSGRQVDENASLKATVDLLERQVRELVNRRELEAEDIENPIEAMGEYIALRKQVAELERQLGEESATTDKAMDIAVDREDRALDAVLQREDALKARVAELEAAQIPRPLSPPDPKEG